MNISFLKKALSRAEREDLTRRCFVRTTIAATAGSLMPLGARFTTPRPFFQTTLSPEAAFNELIEGNQRYVSGNLTAPEHDLQLLHAKNADKQEPFAAVLACADSRVPVELVFDQSIGHLFVCRLAGNVTTPEVVASLEYAAAVLGVRAIMVLGHSNCGAIAATIKGSAEPGQISVLYAHIRPAVNLAGANAEAVTKANARIQAALLAEASTVIAGLVKENKMKIGAAYYDVSNGLVTVV
jgi:carbonic anhydrase